MPRYIAENDVYNLFNARGVAQLHVGDIDVLPRADVVEVIHGRWLDWNNDPMWKECSACGYRAQYIYARSCRYCPNCGAKMDLEDK